MATGELADLYQAYIQRVVNEHDLSAVDDLVSPGYVGSGMGWPENVEDLRGFYRRQDQMRPDWRIDIQETIEVGEWVAVRAFAGGRKAYREDGTPQPPPFVTSVEWLAQVRFVDRMIVEIRLVSLIDHSAA